MVLTKNDATILEMAEMRMFESRLTAIKELQDNAMGVAINQFDNAYAFSVKQIPGPSYNVVKGDWCSSEQKIEDILCFYKDRGISARFDLAPHYVNALSLEKLHKAGFYQSDFHATLCCDLNGKKEVELKNSAINIRPLRGNEFDLYAKIYVEGFGMPASLAASVAANNKVLHDKKGWSFYIASMQNEQVGIGSLFINDGRAILAASAVMPVARNQGIHQALINNRINEAIRQKCHVIVGHAKFGSISQNNMERCGLTMAYTKSIWTEVQ